MKHQYHNDLSELTKLASDIESFTQQHSLDPKTHYALNLCLDEVLTNIINYGLKDQNNNHPFIELELIFNNNEVHAIMKDNGIAFDPVQNGDHDPDTSASIEDRKIGGLGVFFLDQYMDSIQYHHDGSHNILHLTKKLASS